jgi:hypothetical protein
VRYSFNIGAAFPARDEVARFATGLAMISNEWHRSMAVMPKDDPASATDEVRAVRLMLARQQAATCYEAFDFLDGARRQFPRVAVFIDGLGPEAQEHYRRVKAAVDPGSPFHLPWLRSHRNSTMHVPELHPAKHQRGKEDMANALDKAAPLTGTVTHGDTVKTVRFGFADVVSVQLLPWDDPNVMKHLSRARIALGGFVHEALEAYLRTLPRGVVKIKP